MAAKKFACVNCSHRETIMTDRDHLRCPKCGDIMIVIG